MATAKKEEQEGKPQEAMTQEQANELIEQLKKQNASLKQELEETTKDLHDTRQQQAGWLIIAPNPLYDGSIHGIEFLNGQAFIRESQVVPAFEIVPEKQATLEKYYKPDQIKEIRENEKMSSAQRAVLGIVRDFGYKAMYFGVDELEKLQELRNERQAQRRQADLMNREEANASVLLPPGYIKV